MKRFMKTSSVVLVLCMILGLACIPREAAQAATIMKTDVSEPQDGCAFIGIKGDYLAGAQKALDRINEIRKEACKEGVINPATGKKLKSSDYVPIKWSSSLEYIARIRAAEASLTMGHVRTNGTDCFDIEAPDKMTSWGEVLAWNYNKDMVSGVNQWYSEKRDWVKQNANAVTGHYTSMISPANTYVGLGAFYTKQAGYPNTVAGEFSSDSGIDWNGLTLDQVSQKKADSVKNCIQLLEVPVSYIDKLSVPKKVKAGNNYRIYGVCDGRKYLLYKGLWESSDLSVVTVDKNGKITAKKAGKANISVKYGDKTLKVTVSVKK